MTKIPALANRQTQACAPKLGLVEANSLVRAYIVEYGLVVGLLIAILYNSSVLILSWLFFTLYLMFKRRYKWNNTLTDSIAYSLVATLGLYALITWLLNAANDIYVLLSHSDPYLVVAALDQWTGATGYLVLALFLVFFILCKCDLLHCSEAHNLRLAEISL